MASINGKVICNRCGYNNRFNTEIECCYCGEIYMEKVQDDLQRFFINEMGYSEVRGYNHSISKESYIGCYPHIIPHYTNIAQLYSKFDLVYLGSSDEMDFYCHLDKLKTFTEA